VWISKRDMEIIEKANIAKGRAERECEMEAKQALYPAAYADRLAYYRRGFYKRPTPHRVIVVGVEKALVEDFADLMDANRRRDQLKFALDEGHAITVNGEVIGNHFVARVYVEEGHPAVYTAEEIEAWAKEKVEAEMKRWKVVVPPSDDYSQGWPGVL
jgi:hypothetical protein